MNDALLVALDALRVAQDDAPEELLRLLSGMVAPDCPECGEAWRHHISGCRLAHWLRVFGGEAERQRQVDAAHEAAVADELMIERLNYVAPPALAYLPQPPSAVSRMNDILRELYPLATWDAPQPIDLPPPFRRDAELLVRDVMSSALRGEDLPDDEANVAWVADYALTALDEDINAPMPETIAAAARELAAMRRSDAKKATKKKRRATARPR